MMRLQQETHKQQISMCTYDLHILFLEGLLQAVVQHYRLKFPCKQPVTWRRRRKNHRYRPPSHSNEQALGWSTPAGLAIYLAVWCVQQASSWTQKHPNMFEQNFTRTDLKIDAAFAWITRFEDLESLPESNWNWQLQHEAAMPKTSIYIESLHCNSSTF